MKKMLILIAIIIALSFPKNSFAQTTVSAPSAQLAPQIQSGGTAVNILDVRVKALRNVFARHGSILVEEATNYVKYADQNGVDWKLLPAISGVESTFGQALLAGSYNAYGWGGGRIYFNSWEDGIKTIDQALRQNYINHGATDVWSIGPIYAESPTWSVRVNRYMNEINEEYLRLSTFSSIPNI